MKNEERGNNRMHKEGKCVNLCWQSGSPKNKKTVSISFFSSFVLPPSISVICSFIPLPPRCYRPCFVCMFMHSCLLVVYVFGARSQTFLPFCVYPRIFIMFYACVHTLIRMLIHWWEHLYSNVNRIDTVTFVFSLKKKKSASLARTHEHIHELTVAQSRFVSEGQHGSRLKGSLAGELLILWHGRRLTTERFMEKLL